MVRDRPSYRVLYLVFALGVLQAVGLLAFEAYRTATLDREVRRLEAENAELWRRVRELEATLAATRTPAFLEAEARRLGLVKKDETLHARKTH